MRADKPKRGAMTPARMKRIWEREQGICWLCTQPVSARGPEVRYDHRIPLEIIGHDGDENIYPIHREPCDRLKTAADQTRIAKAKAQGGETGQWARRQKNGPKMKARPFPKGPKRPWPKRSFR